MAASVDFDASAAADANQVAQLTEFQNNFNLMMESLRAGAPLQEHKNDIRCFHLELAGMLSYLTDPAEKKRAEDYERHLHDEKTRIEADRKRYEHAKICRDNAEVLTPSELARRVKEGNLAETYSLAGYYGEQSFIGYYYVDDDHWITGPKEGSPHDYCMIYGLGWEAKHNQVTDRVTVEYGYQEWFVGFFSVLADGDKGVSRAVIRRLRGMGCVTV
jgi:hypothetical protein